MTTLPDGELEPESIRRPGLGLLLLESRAVLEMAALPVAYPLLRRAPRGDGHPVLVREDAYDRGEF